LESINYIEEIWQARAFRNLIAILLIHFIN